MNYMANGMKKSCVILLTNDFPPYFSGGISNYYLNLAKNTEDISIRVMAPWCRLAKRHDRLQGITATRVLVPIGPSAIKRSIQMVIMFISALIETYRSDVKVVVIGHLYLAPAGYLLKIIRGIPYMLIMHGGEEERYSRGSVSKRLSRHLVDASDLIIANSNYTRDEIRAGWGYGGSMCVLHPGVDTERFFPQRRNNKEHHVEDHDFILLSVGTLVKRKGHENTLKALAKIRDEVPDMKVKYLIIGRGPEMERLKHLAYEELGLGDSVDFLGFVGDEKLADYYNLSDVFIMPSMKTEDKFGTEGFGIVYLEANACGKPVIGGCSGGVSDAVVDGETGILVDPDSVEEIAEAIIFLYENRDAARAMGEKGLARVKEEFQWHKIAKEFSNIIKEYFYPL